MPVDASKAQRIPRSTAITPGAGLVAVGLNHRTAPIDLRDRVAVGGDALAGALEDLIGRPGVHEAAVLSTCNRTEITAWGSAATAAESLIAWLGERAGLATDGLRPHIYTHRDRDAVRHLFRVATGLDSMILGEAQVLGQTREAYRVARETGAAGRVLCELYDAALRAARRARQEAGIARGAVSISFAAVELARQIFGDLRDKEVLVVGAGKMSRQTMDNLREQGARACFVANRSLPRAEQLAAEFGATVYPWDRLNEALGRVDIVITSTTAPEPVLKTTGVQAAMKRRRNRPLFIVDIAVPRDAEPQIAELYNVFLFNIDDLKAVIEENIARRMKDAAFAEEIITDEVAKFWTWLRSMEASDAIVQLRQWADAQRASELDRLIRKAPDLTPAHRDAVEEFSRRLMNKFLDPPLRGIKSAYRINWTTPPPAHAEGTGAWILGSLRHLFGLEHPSEPPGESRGLAGHEDAPAPPFAQGAEDGLDELDRRLCDILQTDFPLVPQPFAAISRELNCSETDVLRRVQAMKDSGVIRQISAIFDSRRLGYRSLLAAFGAPPDRLEIVAAAVSAHPGVSHSYEREHRFNLWFTMTVPPGVDPVAECERLAAQMRVSLWAPFPAIQTFKIGVSFSMGREDTDLEAPAVKPSAAASHSGEKVRDYARPSDEDIALIRALQRDIPINSHPFRLQAEKLGLTEEDLLNRAGQLRQRRLMRRFAAVLRHRQAGYSANGMACWTVPAGQIGEIGPRVAAFTEVSHCYERRPAPPAWPYNLFAMIHARRREDVKAVVDRISACVGLSAGEILFSAREFKKERVVYFPEEDDRLLLSRRVPDTPMAAGDDGSKA